MCIELEEALFFPPVVLCCRLPDCWSIKIIVMEIDLIDNVPCSHCEQLVPCEHNPETSSKNFPPQTFNPSSSFCPSLQKMKKAMPGKRKAKILSCWVPAEQVRMGAIGWAQGSRRKGGEWIGGEKTPKAWGNKIVILRRKIDQNGFPILVLKIHSSSLCLIWNSGSGSPAPAQSDPTWETCQERWHLVDPSSHEGGLWLSPDLAPCLKTEDRRNGKDHWEKCESVKAQDKPVFSGGKTQAPGSWIQAPGLNVATQKPPESGGSRAFVPLVSAFFPLTC